jgi:hypothetical protein
MTLTLLNQGVLLEYNSGVWVILSDDLPLSQLDGRYVPQTALTGGLAIASGGTGQTTALAAFDALSPMTTYGDLVYEGNSGTALRLAGSTSATKRFLTQTGTGTVSAAPAWGQIAAADLAASPVTGAVIGVSGAGSLFWTSPYGTAPEAFSGATPDVQINAAISAVNAGTRPGPVILTAPGGYELSNTVTAMTGVNFVGNCQGNRQVTPDTLTGGYLYPSPSFPASTPLVTVGANGDSTTNPNGIKFVRVGLSGYTGSGYITGCYGIGITQTADVHLNDCFLADFGRSAASGACVQLTSAATSDCYGFCATYCVFSYSNQGVIGNGPGCTDFRFSGNLWHANTQALTLGMGLPIGTSAAGGGGCQIAADHFVGYTSQTTGWQLSLGSQAGDFIIGAYFDEAGTVVPVQLSNGKGILNNSHFLAYSGTTAAALVTLSGSNQELTFIGNDCQASGSSLAALLQLTGLSGTTPTGGVYLGNSIYNSGGSPNVIVNESGTAIGATSSSSVYVAGNVVYS